MVENYLCSQNHFLKISFPQKKFNQNYFARKYLMRKLFFLEILFENHISYKKKNHNFFKKFWSKNSCGCKVIPAKTSFHQYFSFWMPQEELVWSRRAILSDPEGLLWMAWEVASGVLRRSMCLAWDGNSRWLWGANFCGRSLGDSGVHFG